MDCAMKNSPEARVTWVVAKNELSIRASRNQNAILNDIENITANWNTHPALIVASATSPRMLALSNVFNPMSGICGSNPGIGIHPSKGPWARGSIFINMSTQRSGNGGSGGSGGSGGNEPDTGHGSGKK